MRKLVQYSLLSVDGVAEEPGKWVSAFDDECAANLARVIGEQDAVLLGRHSYDDWAGYWPTADTQPFAGFINAVPKYLFTSSPPAIDWENTTIVDTPALDFVRDLKTKPGGNIGVHGSMQLSRALLAAGLVDELELVIFPTIAGSGRRLFTDDGAHRALELVNERRTPAGALLVSYRLPAATRTATGPSA